ncbi:MAG: HEAT repeat domain-containing protein [Elusimicrobiota bacterium]
MSASGGAEVQAAIVALISLWAAACAYLYISQARDGVARVKRYFAACLMTSVPVYGLWVIISVGVRARPKLYEIVPGILEFGLRDLVFVPFVVLLTFLAACVLLLPVLALSFISPDERNAWRKAALLGALWGVFFAPPFPTRFATWNAVLVPGAFAILAPLLLKTRVVYERLRATKLRGARAWAFAGLGLGALLFVFARHQHSRMPRPGWPIPALVDALRSGDMTVGWLAREVLSELDPASRRKAVIFLVQGIENESPEVQRRVVRALSRRALQTKDAMHALSKMLKEASDPDIRADVARTLGESSAEEAVLAFVGVLGDRDPSVRSAAIRALRKLLWAAHTSGRRGAAEEECKSLLRRHGSVAALIRVLRDDEDSDVRVSAARMLGGFEESSPALIEAVADGSSRVREAAIDALKAVAPRMERTVSALVDRLERGEDAGVLAGVVKAATALDAKEAVPVLIRAMEYEDPGIRAEAVAALGRFCTMEAVAALVRASSNGDAEIRRQAAGALDECRASGSVPFLVRELGDPDREVRRKALEALRARGPSAQDALPLLIRAFEKESDWSLRPTILETLVSVGGERSVRGVIRLMKGTDPGMRSGAARRLRDMGRPAVSSLVEILRADEDAAMRRTAAETLGELRATQAVPALIQALEDGDTGVGHTAVLALGLIGPPAKEAVPALVGILNKEKRSRIGDSSSWSLGRIGTPEALEAVKRHRRESR